jgi:hypothetical protein
LKQGAMETIQVIRGWRELHNEKLHCTLHQVLRISMKQLWLAGSRATQGDKNIEQNTRQKLLLQNRDCFHFVLAAKPFCVRF